MRIPFRTAPPRSLEPSQLDFRPERPTSHHNLDQDLHSQERNCGDCHACCIHLPIPAGEVCMNIKPTGVHCPNLTDLGCRIYETRPVTCQQFQCVWLTDTSWPPAWRPERSGLLCLREEIENGVLAALVYEIERDALARPTSEWIITKLAESTTVVAVVNLQRQRRLLRGGQWTDEAAHPVRRPHFLRPIHSIHPKSTEPLRDAS